MPKDVPFSNNLFHETYEELHDILNILHKLSLPMANIKIPEL